MGKFTGLVMIAAGLGTAAYVYPMIGADGDRAEKQLADVVAIATPHATEQKRTSAPLLITKSDKPETPRVFSAPQAAPAQGAPALPYVAPAPSPVVAALAPAPVLAAKPIEAPIPQPVKRSKLDDDKSGLARSIQSELKRVGCFQGEADGTWNTATRQAMKSFIDRVNATLPVDEPDHILKTLVQGHPGNACGKSCPAGQSASADGRCLPTTVLTQAPTTTRRPAEVAAVASQPAARTPPAPQAAQNGASVSSWETTTTAVAPPVMAAIAAAAGVTTDARRPVELPGRMAIGAASPIAVPQQDTASTSEPPKSRFAVAPKASNADEAGDAPVGRTAPPAPRVAAYRAPPPPPRYVGAFAPQPARVARPRFGPQIFKQLEQSGR